MKHSPAHPGPDGMTEWLRRETSEPGVLGSNPLKSVTVQKAVLSRGGLGETHYSGTACCNKCELSQSQIAPLRTSFIIGSPVSSGREHTLMNF